MLRLEIVTPDGPVFQGDIDSVSVPTPQGEITVLPHHIPLLSIVSAGSLTIRTKDGEQLFAVSRGVIEIEGTTVRVLTDTADRAEALSEEAIEKAQEKARKLMNEKRGDVEGFAEATAILERELARLHVARRHRSRRGPRADSSMT